MDSSQLYWVKPGQNHGPDHYANEIFLNTNIIPTQCYYVNDNTALFIKFPQGTNLDKWHSTKNLKELEKLGLTLKLNSIQMDKNSVFINSAPETIFNLTQEALIEHINENNTNIKAIGAYVPPKRGHMQKLGSVKLTVVTRNMVNSILSYGIRIAGCHIEPGSIRQAHYLKEPQCSFCYKFHSGKCQSELPNCPICSKHHNRHQCREKDNLKCSNCGFPHKSTSNNCRVRSNMLTNDLINDIDLNSIKCPFGKALQQAPNLAPTSSNSQENINTEWPPINNNCPPQPTPTTTPWGIPSANTSIPPTSNNTINPLAPMAPMTTYSDVLKMALMFNEWYTAFITLMGIFGLPKVEFPPSLRAQIKGRVEDTEPTIAQPATYPIGMLNPIIPTTSNTSQHISTNQIFNQHMEAQSNALQTSVNAQISFPLTGANTVPLPIRQPKDKKGHNKSSKGNGLLPTPSEPLLPSSISLPPPPSTHQNPPVNKPKNDNSIPSKELQWGDEPSNKAWITPTEITPEPTIEALDMPFIEGTQILYTNKSQDTNSNNRLSMDSDQFKSTLKNFENLSGTKPKVPTKSKNSSQSKQPIITQTSQKTLKTKFNLGSNKKISPKPKAIARPPYKHSTPSPQKEGMCTSSESESETDSNEEVNIDDVEVAEFNETESEDVLEDLTRPATETTTETIPNRRQLRSNSKSSTNL